MTETTIFRTPTNAEKKEIKILGEKDLNWYFKKKNEIKQTEYTQKHKPYCFRCAKLDFEDAIDQVKRESRRHRDGSRLTIEDINKIHKQDLDKYAEDSYFEVERVEEAMEQKLLDGIKQSVKIGEYHHFKCKKRGCRNCVFVPNKLLKQNKK